MMNRLLNFVLMTGFLFAIANPAMAHPTAQQEADARARAEAPGSRWYVAGGLGATYASDSDNTLAGFPVTVEFDTGGIASVAFGHEYLGVRAEGELLYNRNDVSGGSVSGISVPASGDVSTVAFMANLYYDFKTGSKWEPFIGGGIGYADVSINDLSGFGFTIVDDSAGVFAFQFKAGIGYAFTDSLDGTFGYRFFGTTDGDFTNVLGGKFTADGLRNHSLELGVRFWF